jgi:DNA polymerase V
MENRTANSPHAPLIRLLQQPDFGPALDQVLLPGRMAPIQLTPLYSHSISAGFPSPADDYIEDRLDLNELLVNNKAATFFLRVKGDSMVNAGIHHGDIIVVDRSVQPVHRSIVVAVVDGELTVKRLITRSASAELHAENPKYAPICLQEGQELTIWGVVTSSVHQVK